MPSVSQTELKLTRKCAKAADYKYGQNLVRRKPDRPQFIGSILHEMLHAWVMARLLDTYKNDPWKVLEKYQREYAKLFKEEKELYGDIPVTVERIFEGYLRRWGRDEYKYVASEVSVITDLTKDIRLIGKIDKIVEDGDGRRFLMEHKFHKTLPGPEDRFSDIQTVLYLWAWNQSNPPEKHLDGVLWDYGRMKAPTVPDLLKNGELSKRMNIDTDRHTYMEAIRDNRLNPKEYKTFLKGLEGKERTFFERVPLPSPKKSLIEAVVSDARQTAVIYKHLRKNGIAPRSMSGFNCNRCEYRALCEAEVRGLDAKFVRKHQYEEREYQGDSNRGVEDQE